MSQKNGHPVRDMIFSDLGKIAKVLGAVAGTIGAAMVANVDEKADTKATDSKADLHDDDGFYASGNFYASSIYNDSDD